MSLFSFRLPIPKDLVINFAGMIFIGCAVFLFWSESQMARLLTLQGVGFFFGGLLFCGIFIGWPLAKAHQAFSYRLLAKNNGEMNETTMQVVRLTGTAVMILQVVAVYYLSQKLFYGWLLNQS